MFGFKAHTYRCIEGVVVAKNALALVTRTKWLVAFEWYQTDTYIDSGQIGRVVAKACD